jgi:hypothetical protein
MHSRDAPQAPPRPHLTTQPLRYSGTTLLLPRPPCEFMCSAIVTAGKTVSVVRSIVLGWIHDVVCHHDAHSAVYFMAAALFDRAMATYVDDVDPAGQGLVQALATVAFMLAYKVLQAGPAGAVLSVKHLALLTARACSVEDLLRLETEVVLRLRARLVVPTIHTFAELLALFALQSMGTPTALAFNLDDDNDVDPSHVHADDVTTWCARRSVSLHLLRVRLYCRCATLSAELSTCAAGPSSVAVALVYLARHADALQGAWTDDLSWPEEMHTVLGAGTPTPADPTVRSVYAHLLAVQAAYADTDAKSMLESWPGDGLPAGFLLPADLLD